MAKLLQTVFFSQQNMNTANSENDQKRTIYFSINCFRNAVLSFQAKNMNAANSENDLKRTIYFIINCFRNAVLSFKAKLEQKREKLKNEDEAGIGQEEFYD